MKTINLNDTVKVKLTQKGIDVFYNQFETLHNRLVGRGESILKPKMPEIDKDGFTSFQLHHLMNLYGEHMDFFHEPVFENMRLYFDDGVLEDVKNNISGEDTEITTIDKCAVMEDTLLPCEPIDCAKMLIDAACECETTSIQRAFGASEKQTVSLYSVEELRQIAEHLLVYCNHNENKGE